MGLPEGLAAREFAVCVVEGVRAEVAVVAAMWDATRVLLIGVEGREVARDELWGSGKRRPVTDFEGVCAAEGDGESCWGC
jgi:hypothetical protein